jgi:hypothetical protein
MHVAAINPRYVNESQIPTKAISALNLFKRPTTIFSTILAGLPSFNACSVRTAFSCSN